MQNLKLCAIINFFIIMVNLFGLRKTLHDYFISHWMVVLCSSICIYIYMYILDVINGIERIGLYRDDQIGEMRSASGIQDVTVLYI